MNGKISKIVVVGGGTAGWITASLLIKVLGKALEITLVESEQIGTIGVGEATIPPILHLNRALGFDEDEFVRATHGTFKLGIQFENWCRKGDAYMHAFGGLGKDFPFCHFHHFWTRGRQLGRPHSFWDYSLNYQAAAANRFAKVERIQEGDLQGLVYAYHFDAGLYARYLRKFAESLGVTRVEGMIGAVNLDPASGFVSSVTLKDGTRVEGDLFIDCSGFRGLLIEEALNTGYEDYGHWLPCDRAIAVGCAATEPLAPYTRSIAHDAGWQWRIPLQHRTGNGLVYCSRYLDADGARELLLRSIDGPPLNTPLELSFRPGRRRYQWNRNVVAIGLSSGFLEPLESTAIHLIQSGVTRLMKNFPHAGVRQVEVDEYNRQSQVEFEHIRDFIILHYRASERDDTQFWRECRRISPPDSLARRIELFRQTGKVHREQDELFSEIAWYQVMIGQGIVPSDYHPLVDALDEAQLDEFLGGVRAIVDKTVAGLPTHRQYIDRHCRIAQ